MQKRMILAVFLSGIVLFFYNLYCYHNPPSERKQQAQIKTTSPLQTTTKILQEKNSVSAPKASNFNLSLKDLIIKTKLIETKLSPQGNINSFKLNNYFVEDHKNVFIVKKDDIFTEPLSLYLQGEDISLKGFTSLSAYEKEFVYYYKNNSDLKLVKRYVFYPEEYFFNLYLTLKNSASSDIHLKNLALNWCSSNIGNIDKKSPNNNLIQVYFKKGKMSEVKYKGEKFLDKASSVITGQKNDLEGIRTYEVLDRVSWIAEHDQYFTSVVIPQDNMAKAVFEKYEKNKAGMSLYIENILVKAKEDTNINFKIYLGPKVFERLKALSKDAEKLSGLNSIALVLLWTLKALYKFCHNYGLAIILLTILVKIILYPLTTKSLKSMKAMSEIQPKLLELKEKYRDNKEKFNQELMLLYKRHKVNPLGGCLPLILQLPVFYALFATFQTAIELRNANFIFWLQDLSQKDPYYIMPALMGITMLIQQKMTPTTDPKQAKIMMLMPLMLTILFLNFPAGLMLYWIVQNILSIGQQYLVMHSKKN